MTTAHAAFSAPARGDVTFLSRKIPAITMTLSSAISKTDGVRNSLFPQKCPRMTAYTEENAKPSNRMRKTLKARSSENKKVNLPPNKPKIKQKGRVSIKQAAMPAPTARRSPAKSCSALLLDIMRDTVMGIPPEPTTANSPNKDRAIWYKPKPSAPNRRDNTIRYKKPRNRSATDSPVTIEALTITLFFIILLYEPHTRNRTERKGILRFFGAYIDSDVEDKTYKIL